MSRAERSERPPLVLIHGFTGAPADWDPVVARLTSRETVRIALLGHGAKERISNAQSFEEEVDRVAALLCSVLAKGKKAELCGYSMGARVCLGLLLRHGALFSRAWLVGVHPGLGSLEEKAYRRNLDAGWIKLLSEQGIEAFARAWEAQPVLQTAFPPESPLRLSARERRLRHDPFELARALSILGLAEMPDYSTRLASIDVPVCLTVGGYDAKFRSIAGRTAPTMKRGSVRVVRDAGHNVLLERPDALAELIEGAHDD